MSTVRNVDILLDEATMKVRSEPQAVADLVGKLIQDESVRPSVRTRALLIKARADLQLGRYDQGERTAREAESLARSAGLRIEEALALNEVGIFRFVRTDRTSALNYYEAARDLLMASHAKAELARVYVNIGNVHQINEEHFYAIEAYETAADLAREVDDVLTQAKVHSNLGSLFQNVLFDRRMAEEHFGLAIDLYRQINDSLGVTKTLAHRGNGLLDLERYEEAAQAFRESIQMRGMVNEPTEIALSYYGLIRAMDALGKVEEASEAFASVIGVLGEVATDDSVRYFIDVSRSRVLHLKGRTQDAVELLEELQQLIVDANGSRDIEIEELLCSYRHALGQHDEAMRIARGLFSLVRKGFAQKTSDQLSSLKAHVRRVKDDLIQEMEYQKGVEVSRSQQVVEAVRKEHDDYVNYLSHELKSPLDSIRAIAELLQHEGQTSTAERQEYSKEIHTISMRLLELINTTLDASRDRHVVKLGTVNLTTILTHLLNVAETRCDAKQITLVRKVEAESLPVMATEQLVVTIVENLLSNAIKFSQSGSEITVQTRRLMGNDAVSRVLLAVKDEGPGVSEEDQKRLFKPFQRLSAKPSANEGSHGIGLHLVKRAVDTLGGRIWVESGMDQGATFFVELPMALHER